MIKKIAVMVALAVAVTGPAFAAKKKMKREMEVIPQKVDTNEASWRLVRDSFPLWLPNAMKPLYFKIKEDEEAREKAESKKVRKAKRSKTSV